jgi:ketol-acid reductoisomerase
LRGHERVKANGVYGALLENVTWKVEISKYFEVIIKIPKKILRIIKNTYNNNKGVFSLFGIKRMRKVDVDRL